jgi:hypothetical protein
MNRYAFPVVIIIVFTASSCSTLLKATFESDALGSPPATNLPGSPSGDTIEFNAAMAPQLKVQNSAISGDKALFYSNAAVSDPPPVASRWISFKGVATDLTKTIWFQHTGENMGSVIMIDISDGHLGLMARMRIMPDGEIGLATNINDTYSDVIGTLASGAHTIIFTVSTSSLKYNVTIIQAAGPTITATNKPTITQNLLSFANPASPKLSFLQQGSGSLTYAIGSVEISRKKP